MSSADQDIESLKGSTRHLEAEINALIERSPALRSVKIEQLPARGRVQRVLVAIYVREARSIR